MELKHELNMFSKLSDLLHDPILSEETKNNDEQPPVLEVYQWLLGMAFVRRTPDACACLHVYLLRH